MNLFKKIGVAVVGMAMAIGVGVALGGKAQVREAKASTTIVSWSRVKSVSTLTAGGTFIIGYEATAKSETIIPMGNTGSATTSGAGFIYTGSTVGSGNTGTLNMKTLAAASASHEVEIGASSAVDGAIYIKLGDNYLGNTNTKNNCKLFETQATTTSFTPTIDSNDCFTLDIAANTSGSAYRYLKYNTGAPRFAVYSTKPEKIVIYKKNVTTKYSVSYDANGGTGTTSDASSPYVSGSSVTVLDSSFTAPSGKMFDHWNTEIGNGGTSYNAGQSFTITADVTLYAQWVDVAPTLSLNYNSLSKYTIDDAVTLTATPANFPDGDITYVWSSDNKNAATVGNVSTASSNVTFVGRGTANIKVEAYQGDTNVPANKKAEKTCIVTVYKTRNVSETTSPKAVYDFSSLTTTSERSSSDIVGCKSSTEFASDPTITVTKAYGHADGGVRLATSSATGSLTFNFGTQNINHIKTYIFGWNASEGSVSVTNYATNLEPNSTTAQLFEFDLSANATSIAFECVGGSRAIIKSIEFSYVSTSNVGRTADVVGLENFIDTYLRSDLAYDADPELPVNDTTECETLYPNAKNAFNGTSGEYKLNDHQRKLFAENSAYANELARLSHWAEHNGDELNGNNLLASKATSVMQFGNGVAGNSTAIIVIISLMSFVALGGFFMLKKKKEQ